MAEVSLPWPQVADRVRILSLFRSAPGKDLTSLLHSSDISPDDAGTIANMERTGLIVFKSGGWYNTGAGDRYLLEWADKVAKHRKVMR